MSQPKNERSESESPESLAEPEAPAQIAVPNTATKQTSVARSAGIVSIAVMFSRIFGLVREMIFARYFGAGFLYDAYVVAFRIPNVLRDLFAEGALSVAFVKVFTDYQINKGEKEAWRLASLVLNALAVVMSVCLHYRHHIFAPIRPPHRRRILSRKGSASHNADADNVPVHPASRPRCRRDGRAQHKGSVRNSGIRLDRI